MLVFGFCLHLQENSHLVGVILSVVLKTVCNTKSELKPPQKRREVGTRAKASASGFEVKTGMLKRESPHKRQDFVMELAMELAN